MFIKCKIDGKQLDNKIIFYFLRYQIIYKYIIEEYGTKPQFNFVKK